MATKAKQKETFELDTEAIAVFEHRLAIFEKDFGLPPEVAISLAESVVTRESVRALLDQGCPEELLVGILT